MLAGLAPAVAFVAGMGFVLSSTAVVMQVLDETGETSTPQGQKAVSILLLEDLAIVPLLAAVAFLAHSPAEPGAQARWVAVGIALAAVAALVAAGRWLLNAMFRILAAARAREVMTAAALLIVLGAAVLMQLGGLSMAMGAFLAGVLLSESTFRHQLEADIEPFRGILLGLFFIAVGMSLDLPALARDWQVIALAVVCYTLVKALGIFAVARAFGSGTRAAITRTSLFAQGGEFAFVLYAAATSAGILDAATNTIFTATVILSMAITPVVASLVRRWMPPPPVSTGGVDAAENLRGDVLVIGFGRFGQVASQALLARGLHVSIIESDVEMIQAASSFGFKVYYGDGTRLDILHASGAGRAQGILVCIDDATAATRMAHLIRAQFPLIPVFVRAFDRGHALDLIAAGVDYQIRETFESAMLFSGAVLRRLGVPEEEVADLVQDVRRRDAERLELQTTGGLYAGADLMRGNRPVPEPLTAPKRAGQVIGALPDGAMAAAERD